MANELIRLMRRSRQIRSSRGLSWVLFAWLSEVWIGLAKVQCLLGRRPHLGKNNETIVYIQEIN